MIRQFLSKGGF
jgi:threonyl-tRNA synthetase